MSNSFPLATLAFKKRSSAGNASTEALLELLPFAGVIVDVQSQRILFANGKATELTAFTRVELTQMTAKGLFPTLDKHTFLALVKRNEVTLTIINRRSGVVAEVQLSPSILGQQEKWVLLALEPVESLEQRDSEQRRQECILDAYYALAQSFHQTGLQEALDTALQAGSLLTNASLMAVYQAEGGDYTLKRSAVLGPAELLPEHIHPNDLINLQTPTLWTAKKRTSTPLHRAARASNLAFLASAPLGQANALIGLLAAAGDHELPPDETLAFLRIVAAAVSAIIQTHALTSNLEQNLTIQNRDAKVGTSIRASVQDGIILISPDRTILELNPSAESILGYASREVKGWPYQNILVGLDNLIPPFVTDDEGVNLHNHGNVRMYRRDGQTFLANLRTLPILNDDRLDCLIVLIQDLSQEEQHRIHSQQLEQRAVIGEVSAIFAHEVRNPINNISTGLQLMALNLPEDDSNQELLARLQQDCDRLEDLMKSTLAFVRPMEYKMEAVDLQTALPRLLERWRPHMARVNIQHHLQVDPDTPPVSGDIRALEQVWNNLIGNAIQAMGRDGSLTLKVRPVQTNDNFRRVEVSITDSGPGIPDDIRDRIFEPFFTTNRSGTGLGLSIAKHIVTTHRGTLQVTSFPGATSFQVQLPIANENNL